MLLDSVADVRNTLDAAECETKGRCAAVTTTTECFPAPSLVGPGRLALQAAFRAYLTDVYPDLRVVDVSHSEWDNKGFFVVVSEVDLAREVGQDLAVMPFFAASLCMRTGEPAAPAGMVRIHHNITFPT